MGTNFSDFYTYYIVLTPTCIAGLSGFPIVSSNDELSYIESGSLSFKTGCPKATVTEYSVWMCSNWFN